MKPRGASTGFFNRQKSISSIVSPSLQVENKNYKEWIIFLQSSYSLALLPFLLTPSPVQNISLLKNDTLQAPSDKNYNKNGNRYSNYLKSSKFPVYKRERKSNLDLLVIFDTRRYFFIPPNRRTENKDGGIFSNIISFFSK